MEGAPLHWCARNFLQACELCGSLAGVFSMWSGFTLNNWPLSKAYTPLLCSALLPEEITWLSPPSTPAPADKAPLCNIQARCVSPLSQTHTAHSSVEAQRSWQEHRQHLLLSWGCQRRLNVLKSPRIYPMIGSPHYFCSRVVKMIVEATARMTQSAAIMLFCLTDGGDTQMTLLKKKTCFFHFPKPLRESCSAPTPYWANNACSPGVILFSLPTLLLL